MEIEEKAMDLLRNHALCDHCLGRMFARYGRGLKNEERGKSIKAVLTMEAHNRIGEERKICNIYGKMAPTSPRPT